MREALGEGHIAVVVFIVRSGFSLMLPVVMHLVQHPLLRIAGVALYRLHVSRDAHLVLQLVFVTPAICLVAWLFAQVFGKPFLSAVRM